MTTRWKAACLLLSVALYTSTAYAQPVCQGNPDIVEPYGVDLDDILAMMAAMSGQVCQYTRTDTDFPDPDCPWDLCSNNCNGVPSVDVDDLLAVLYAFRGDAWGSICPAIECEGTNVCRPVADAGPDVNAFTGDPVLLSAKASHWGTYGMHSIRWDFGLCVVGLRTPAYHRFNSPGTYSVDLLLVDLSGRADADAVVVHVADRATPLLRADIDWSTKVPELGCNAECPDGYRVFSGNLARNRQ